MELTNGEQKTGGMAEAMEGADAVIAPIQAGTGCD